MPANVFKLKEIEVLVAYPIKIGDSGWYFRMTEMSAGVWLAEGMDLWGRKVSAQGDDPRPLIESLSAEARKLNEALGSM